jgi:tetratricopeptide (TPR) repeat protein
MAGVEIGQRTMHSPESPDPLTAFESDAPAQAVVALLGKGKWRQARDEAKVLCKKDRNKYLPLLVAANTGLFRDLLSRNLSTDAKTVLENLKTLCPKEFVERLERDMVSNQVAHAVGGAALPAAGLNLLWEGVKHFAAEGASGADATHPDWLLVDSVVTAFTPAPDENGDALGSRLAAELAMVHAACKAVSEGRMEETVDALRPLPANSVFRHWKIFLRGVRHFFRGAKKEAEECFSRLPPGGACATAAATILNRSHPSQIPAVSKTAWILATVGEAPAKAREILTADECWRKGNWNGAKDALARVLGKDFSIKQRGIERAFSDDLFRFDSEASPTETKRLDQIADFFCQQRDMLRTSEIHFSVWHRMLLANADCIPDANLEREFGEILMMSSDFLGPNTLRDSIIYEHLGDLFAANTATLQSTFLGRNIYKARHAERALKAFTRATESAPENEFAWVKLLILNEKLGNKSRVNQLLDELVVRFPRNKDILVKAGTLAIERKAFGKGIDYLEAAHQLDPLDAERKTQLIAGLAKYAVHRHKKNQSTVSLWERMEPLLDASPDCWDFRQAKWAMDTLRLALEGRVDSAANCSSLFFEFFISREVSFILRDTWRKQWLETPISAAGWISLLRIYDLADMNPDFPKWQKTEMEDALLGKINAPEVKRSMEADPRSLFGFVGLLMEWYGDQERGQERFIGKCLSKLSSTLRKLLKENLISSEPRVDFCLCCADAIQRRKKPAGILEDLRKIDDEALALGLDDVRQAVTNLRKNLNIEPEVFIPKKRSPRRVVIPPRQPDPSKQPDPIDEGQQLEFDL